MRNFKGDKDGKCAWCRPGKGKPWCIKTIPLAAKYHLFCTRAKGHNGPCVACGTDMHQMTWTGDKEAFQHGCEPKKYI